MDLKFNALGLNSLLAKNPNKKPTFSKTIKDGSLSSSIEVADPRAIRSLILIMDQFAVNGGAAAHWGGPSAISEIISSVFAKMFESNPWNENFNFVNDIGHAENALYALKALYNHAGITLEDLATFRSFPSKLTGHGESHLFPEGVLLSNGPLGSAFPQSQGLACADKLLGNNRITVCLLSDGAFMEGESKEALSAIPGLTSKNKINPYILFISYNDTKLSGRIEKDSFSIEGQLNALSNMGWDLRWIDNGHDLELIYNKFSAAIKDLSLSPNKPICFITKTVKGYGIQKTETMSSGGHGYPLKKYDSTLLEYLKEIWGSSIPEEILSLAKKSLIKSSNASTNSSSQQPIEKEKIQAGFARGAIKAKQQGLPVVSISADLQGSTGIAPFHKEFPQCSFDIGIAESNMVSMASGMSKLGFIPIVDTFAAFGVTKGNLPLIMASLSEAPVMAFFSHIGFQDAADGASHQSLTYFSALSSIPNTVLVTPASSSQAEKLVEQCLLKMVNEKKSGNKCNNYIFLTGREDSPKSYGVEHKDVFGSPLLLKEGTSGILVSQGPLLEQAIEASNILAKDGFNFTVVHNTFPNLFDSEFWLKLLSNNKGPIISIEDHQEKAGIGNFLLSQIVQNMPGMIKLAKCLGVNGHFGQSAHQSVELYSHHGLDASSIAKTAREMLS